MRRAWTPAIASFAALFSCSAAHAAFAPQMSVDLNPPVAGQVPEVRAHISQTGAEPALRRFTLRFPPGFVVNRSLTAPACTTADAAARTCPDATRIGHLESSLGDGPLYLTDAGRHAVALAGLLAGNDVRGAFRPGLGDSLDVSLDGLPTVPLASLTVVLDGGDKGLVRTAPDCGMWMVTGNFTSWLGDFALAQAPLSVSQCVSDPVTISALRLSRRTLRSGAGMRIRWRLSRAASGTRVYVERGVANGWDRVGSLLGGGDRGENVLVFDGHVRGRSLQPGRYRVVLVPRGGASGAGAGFTVVPGTAPRR